MDSDPEWKKRMVEKCLPEEEQREEKEDMDLYLEWKKKLVGRLLPEEEQKEEKKYLLKLSSKNDQI